MDRRAVLKIIKKMYPQNTVQNISEALKNPADPAAKLLLQAVNTAMFTAGYRAMRERLDLYSHLIQLKDHKARAHYLAEIAHKRHQEKAEHRLQAELEEEREAEKQANEEIMAQFEKKPLSSTETHFLARAEDYNAKSLELENAMRAYNDAHAKAAEAEENTKLAHQKLQETQEKVQETSVELKTTLAGRVKTSQEALDEFLNAHMENEAAKMAPENREEFRQQMTSALALTDSEKKLMTNQVSLENFREQNGLTEDTREAAQLIKNQLLELKPTPNFDNAKDEEAKAQQQAAYDAKMDNLAHVLMGKGFTVDDVKELASPSLLQNNPDASDPNQQAALKAQTAFKDVIDSFDKELTIQDALTDQLQLQETHQNDFDKEAENYQQQLQFKDEKLLEMSEKQDELVQLREEMEAAYQALQQERSDNQNDDVVDNLTQKKGNTLENVDKDQNAKSASSDDKTEDQEEDKKDSNSLSDKIRSAMKPKASSAKKEKDDAQTDKDDDAQDGRDLSSKATQKKEFDSGIKDPLTENDPLASHRSQEDDVKFQKSVQVNQKQIEDQFKGLKEMMGMGKDKDPTMKNTNSTTPSSTPNSAAAPSSSDDEESSTPSARQSASLKPKGPSK